MVRGLLILLAAQSVLALGLWPFVAQQLGGPLILLLGANLAFVLAAFRHTADPEAR